MTAAGAVQRTLPGPHSPRKATSHRSRDVACRIVKIGRDSRVNLVPAIKISTTAFPFDSIVKVNVGPLKRNQTTFLVHEALLIASSPFFRACLIHECRESMSRTIDLLVDQADTFQAFLTWLYANAGAMINRSSSSYYVPIDIRAPSPSTPSSADISGDSPSRVAPRFFPYLRLYIFAFKYLLPVGLKNAIIDRVAQLADAHNSVPNVDDVGLIWDELPPGAQLRDLVLDLFTWKRTEKLLTDGEEHGWSQEFLWELCRRLKQKNVTGASPWKGQTSCCKMYHEHEEDETCGSQRKVL